jgi:hypothetical protein
MIQNNRITDSDMIILQSVESYLKSIGTPPSRNPQEGLFVHQQARDFLYSDIVQRVPRVVGYLLSADMETDTVAQGLNIALSKHIMDPVFVNILMQYLSKHSTPDESSLVGAYLAKVLNKWLEQNTKEPEKSKKGEKTETTSSPNLETVAHIKQAIDQLLGNITQIIATRCGNLTGNQSLAIAACLAMNNNDTIKEVISSDLPITAQLFDVVKDPSNLIRSALLLEKTEIAKLSTNQSAFVDSLKRWVYDKLNQITTQQTYQFLVYVYGTTKPDVSTKFINPKDCGTQYSNLLTVAKQMIN